MREPRIVKRRTRLHQDVDSTGHAGFSAMAVPVAGCTTTNLFAVLCRTSVPEARLLQGLMRPILLRRINPRLMVPWFGIWLVRKS